MINSKTNNMESEEVKNEEKEEEESNSQNGVGDDVKILVGNISSKLASVFNRLIYSISTVRTSLEKEEKDMKKRRKGQTIDLIQLQEEEEIEKKELKKLKRKYKPYQMEYQENRPKRPVSSFFIFYQQKLKQLGTKAIETNAPKISRIASETWKTMTLQQKRPYLQKANETKVKYVQQMRQYFEEHADQIENYKQEKREALAKRKKSKHFQDYEGGNDQIDQRFINRKLKGISMRQMKIEQRKQYSHRPKAPVSSFFIFYQQEAKSIADKYCVNEGKKLSKLASDLWKKMSEEQKKPFDIKALAERQKYHEAMRQYRIKYPQQVQARKKKISASMKRTFHKRMQEEEEAKDSESDSIHSSEQLEESESYESIRSEKQKKEGESDKESKQESEKKLQSPPPKTKKPESRKQNNNLYPHRPRGPVCGFFQYYQKNMKYFFSNEKGQNLGSDLVKRASQKWKQLTDQQKEPYCEMYRVDRERYNQQMEEYKANHPQEYEIYMKFRPKNKNGVGNEDKLDQMSVDNEKQVSGRQSPKSINVQQAQVQECQKEKQLIDKKQPEE